MSTTAQIIPKNDKNDKLLGRLAALAGWLVGGLAVLAFVLSYASLRHLAEANGTGWTLSWVWPLLLDFAMVVFSLAILRGNLRGERTWYPWTLTVIYASLATIANVLDVMTLGLPPAVIAAAVKAIAPLTLVLAFELLMQMVRAEVKRSALIVRTADLRAEQGALTDAITALQGERSSLTQTIASLRAQADQMRSEAGSTPSHARLTGSPPARGRGDQSDIESRRVTVLAMLREGMSTNDIAEAVGVSAATVRRDRQALNGQVQ